VVAVDQALELLPEDTEAAESPDRVDSRKRFREVGEDGRAGDGVVALELDVGGAVDFLSSFFFFFSEGVKRQRVWEEKREEKKKFKKKL